MFGLIPFRNNSTSEFGGTFENFLSDFFNDDFFAAPMGVAGGFNKFSADVRETDNEYLVCAELPGVNKEDISLDYANNTLVVRAIRQEAHDDNKDSYLKKERCYGEFSRSFYLDNVNKEGIRAKFDNGELKIILPKQVSTHDSSSSIFIE